MINAKSALPGVASILLFAVVSTLTLMDANGQTKDTITTVDGVEISVISMSRPKGPSVIRMCDAKWKKFTQTLPKWYVAKWNQEKGGFSVKADWKKGSYIEIQGCFPDQFTIKRSQYHTKQGPRKFVVTRYEVWGTYEKVRHGEYRYTIEHSEHLKLQLNNAESTELKKWAERLKKNIRKSANTGTAVFQTAVESVPFLGEFISTSMSLIDIKAYVDDSTKMLADLGRFEKEIQRLRVFNKKPTAVSVIGEAVVLRSKFADLPEGIEPMLFAVKEIKEEVMQDEEELLKEGEKVNIKSELAHVNFNRLQEFLAQEKADRDYEKFFGWMKKFGCLEEPTPAVSASWKLVVRFDLAGRYVYERRTANGLRERVICDGRTLWHLYPEIGVGAKRPVSRFHRRWLSALVPWLAPVAEDIARGADVRWVDERTIAIVPHGLEAARSTPGRAVQFVETWLVFAEDGRLAERRRVVVPTGQVLLRVTYSEDGSVAWLNGKDKQLATAKLPVTRADAPSLKPEVDRLVVVPMPLRTVESLQKTISGAAKPASGWDEDTAIGMIAAHCASGGFRDARRIIAERYYSDEVDDSRLGFNTLLLAAGQNDNPSGPNRQRVDFQPEDGTVETDLKDYLVALVGGKLAAADGEDDDHAGRRAILHGGR